MLADSGVMHEMLVTTVAAISAGTVMLVLGRRANLPALPLLLLGGVVLGPQVLGIVRPQSLGDGLLVVVELAVGLILFEGGLTLDREGYRGASAMIKRLLSVGVLVTWLGTALALRLVASAGWTEAVIAASLIIVTGPTVVMPLLKRIRLVPRVHNILHWEAVLIEPVGVFIAVLCFEWLGEQQGMAALRNLFVRLGAGTALGAPTGLLIALAVRRSIVPRDAQGIFALACAVLTFGLAESMISKAGLLAVTIAGFVVGLTGGPGLRQLRAFKAELTTLLIGTLFILLAARLHLDQFRTFGWRGTAVVALVILAVRPLSVAVCAAGLGLPRRETALLSWVAPRGIVAGSMASLFAISLEQRGVPNARFVETFTYSVILATIALQGTTAGTIARFLNVRRPRPEGWLVIGAHELARKVASFIGRVAGERTVLVDTNARVVREALAGGHNAINADARDTDLLERRGLADVGHLLALTDNEDLNARICAAWSDRVDADCLFRYSSTRAAQPKQEPESGTPIWYGLARPALLSAEIQRGESSVIECGAEDEPRAGAVLLAAFDGRRVVLDPPSAPSRGRALYLSRGAEYLPAAVRPDLVLTLADAELPALIEQLVSRMVSLYPSLPRDALVRELLQREAAFPSVIGQGVAVPHAYSRRLPQRLCAVARVAKGVRFPGAAEPVRLVFLLLSPSGDPEGHLATLAEIARLVSAQGLRDRLLEASPEDVTGIVQRRGGAYRKRTS